MTQNTEITMISGIQPRGTVVYSAPAIPERYSPEYREVVIRSDRRAGKQIVACGQVIISTEGEQHIVDLYRIEYRDYAGRDSNVAMYTRDEAIIVYRGL